MVFDFIPVAEIQYHRLGGLNNSDAFSNDCGVENHSQEQQILGLFDGFL